MPDLSIGDILINLQTSSTNVTNELQNSIKILRSFRSVLKSIEKIDTKKIGDITAGFNVNKIENSNVVINKTSKNLKKVSDESKNVKKNLGNAFTLGKLYFLFNYTKRFGQSIANIFSYAINYQETLNKFMVSYGNYSQEAVNFANQLTYAFNLSTESVMNYMSTFNNMLNALGSLSPEMSSKLSQTLTRMAINYSSLFNVSIETAMNQFQSVLSGSIRPIRSTSGYDVSETTIFQLYQELGGTKTMRQLSQIEKRLLRILAIQKQMEATGAVEDFSATINNTANQLKQISETTKEIGQYVGTILLHYFDDIIEGALALLIVVKDITKSLAQGFKANIDIGGGAVFEGLTESANSANESLDELNGKLLSFDKFEALNKSEESLSSDLENILGSLGEYGSDLANITSNAREMADSILTWLGYTKEVNEETGETNWELKEGYQNIEVIKDALLTISALGIVSLLANSYKIIVGIVASTSSLGFLLNGVVIVGVFKLFQIIGNLDAKSQAIVGTIFAIIGALVTLTTVITALKAVSTGGSFLAFLPVILAGVGAFSAGIYGMISSAKGDIPKLGNNFSGFFAEGGFPTRGSLFVANEAGAELVGNIGGKTAVANNDMIVQAIENASYRGMVKAMAVQNKNHDRIEFDFRTANDSKVARALAEPMIDELTRRGYKIEKV